MPNRHITTTTAAFVLAAGPVFSQIAFAQDEVSPPAQEKVITEQDPQQMLSADQIRGSGRACPAATAAAAAADDAAVTDVTADDAAAIAG